MFSKHCKIQAAAHILTWYAKEEAMVIEWNHHNHLSAVKSHQLRPMHTPLNQRWIHTVQVSIILDSHVEMYRMVQ